MLVDETACVVEPVAVASVTALFSQCSVEEEQAYTKFVSASTFSKDFPTSMDSVYKTVQEQYHNHCLVDVGLGEMRAYDVPLAVYVTVVHGEVHDLVRCWRLNNKIVQVLMVETICKKNKSGVCEHTGDCESTMMLQVQLVDEDGVLMGNVFRIDSNNVRPHLTCNHRVALGILRSTCSMWGDDTPVVMQFQKEQIDIMRLATEYWANEDKLCEPSEVCHVVSASYKVDLIGMVEYMRVNGDYTEERSKQVHEDIKSFVQGRLSGTNLCGECVVCFEPLRMLPQVRLGCVCGNAGSVKGRMLHLKCAQFWLDEQENIWRAAHEPDNPAAAKGPDGPTCPVCIQRLQGVAPFTADLKAGWPLRPDDECALLWSKSSTSRTLMCRFACTRSWTGRYTTRPRTSGGGPSCRWTSRSCMVSSRTRSVCSFLRPRRSLRAAETSSSASARFQARPPSSRATTTCLPSVSPSTTTRCTTPPSGVGCAGKASSGATGWPQPCSRGWQSQFGRNGLAAAVLQRGELGCSVGVFYC